MCLQVLELISVLQMEGGQWPMELMGTRGGHVDASQRNVANGSALQRYGSFSDTVSELPYMVNFLATKRIASFR